MMNEASPGVPRFTNDGVRAIWRADDAWLAIHTVDDGRICNICESDNSASDGPHNVMTKGVLLFSICDACAKRLALVLRDLASWNRQAR